MTVTPTKREQLIEMIGRTLTDPYGPTQGYARQYTNGDESVYIDGDVDLAKLADEVLKVLGHEQPDDDSPLPDHKCIHTPDTNSHDCNCTYGGDHHMNDFQGFR